MIGNYVIGEIFKKRLKKMYPLGNYVIGIFLNKIQYSFMKNKTNKVSKTQIGSRMHEQLGAGRLPEDLVI